jgi:hypothetical protein
MAHPLSESNLAKQHYVTLIVRLCVDDHGQLIHGEMLDDKSTFQKRFTGGPGLIGAIQAWLTQQEHGGDDGGPQAP